MTLHWRRALVTAGLGFLSAWALLATFGYAFALTFRFSPMGGTGNLGPWALFVSYGLLPAVFCAGYAVLAWMLGFRWLRTVLLALALNLIPLFVYQETNIRFFPNSDHDVVFHYLWSLTLTLLIASRGAPTSTVAARAAAVGVAIVLTIGLAFLPWTVAYRVYILGWALVPGALALFASPPARPSSRTSA